MFKNVSKRIINLSALAIPFRIFEAKHDLDFHKLRQKLQIACSSVSCFRGIFSLDYQGSKLLAGWLDNRPDKTLMGGQKNCSRFHHSSVHKTSIHQCQASCRSLLTSRDVTPIGCLYSKNLRFFIKKWSDWKCFHIFSKVVFDHLGGHVIKQWLHSPSKREIPKGNEAESELQTNFTT